MFSRLTILFVAFIFWLLQVCSYSQFKFKTYPVDRMTTAATSSAVLGDTARFVFNAGWNLISFPFQFSEVRKTEIFPHAVSKAFTYQNGYIQCDTLVSGIGYWIKFAAPETVAVVECISPTDTISVKKGWNMIGSTREKKAVADIISDPPNNISTSYYGYTTGVGYYAVDTLEPCKGYWVKAYNPGKLIYPHIECRLDPPIPEMPYFAPDWHPSGNFIGFNYTPLTFIERRCNGECRVVRYYFDYNSSGYWIIHPDGTKLQRIFPYMIYELAWSPDSEWIAFQGGSSICKMKFTDGTFDTTTLRQLTFGVHNAFPAWSHNGQWIAYTRITCAGSHSCGVWLMDSSGKQQRFIADYGGYPDWSPNGLYLIYVAGEVYKVALNDTSKRTRLTYLNQADPYATDNRRTKYSPDGSKIAFWSMNMYNGSRDIWIMNSDGSNLLKLTTEGVDEDFSWSPDGQYIVYTYNGHPVDYTYKNGTLWIINITTHERRQLTFNNPAY